MLQNKLSPQAANKQSCMICKSTAFTYAFKTGVNKFLQCENCMTILPDQQNVSARSEAEPERIVNRDSDALVKLFLETIRDRSDEGPYLVVSTNKERSLSDKLKSQLPSTTQFRDVSDMAESGAVFGTVMVLTPLTMIQDLSEFLQKIKSTMKQDGSLLFIQPMVDSSQSRLIKRSWLEWNHSHNFYPTRDTLHILILNNGFDRVWFRKARYAYTLDYIHQRLKEARSGVLSAMMGVVSWFPSFLRKMKFKLPSSHIIVSCQLAMPKIGSTLSVILPVFNEKNTFEDLIQALLAKNIEGLRKEVIIVESNSTDGTRELVKKYAEHPDVRIIWQQQPQGKGFAVREGLAAATGDYVLIQDADLEYDINDYESLLVPLRENQAMFVLGTRHAGNWRIREFSDSATTSAIFNLGHLFFTWLVNVLTGQRMTDPFTMFKVFRRDAMFGLDFICKRFDFDHEMVIKLIRKGYQPLELPVNYRARSFAEGKKVSFIKDGLFWVTTDLKLRFGRLGKWPH